MDDSTKLMVTKRDLLRARQEAARRDWWDGFWVAVIVIVLSIVLNVVFALAIR